MKFLSMSKDGGEESRVWAYWLVELKSLFSIVLLRFERGSRDAYHSHAFNSVSWVLRGTLHEILHDGTTHVYQPSLWPICTYRSTLHQVHSEKRSWVLSLRGPWVNHWVEIPRGESPITLTHGRKVVYD